MSEAILGNKDCNKEMLHSHNLIKFNTSFTYHFNWWMTSYTIGTNARKGMCIQTNKQTNKQTSLRTYVRTYVHNLHTCVHIYIYKVKWSRCRPDIAQTVRRGVALHFNDGGTRRYIYTSIYTHTYIHTYTHTYIHTYIHNTYIYTYIHNTCIHIYSYVHTHTHIHTKRNKSRR